MSKVCVVIPVHSPTPTAYELVSFKQCFKILHRHPIVVVAPEGLALQAYRECFSDFNVRFINPHWQSSIRHYNRLKLSRYFYRLFDEYQYLLTYELDAFVFRDELLEWCAKDYDYIGAPWFEGFGTPTDKLTGVGNSGFSLRKVASVQNVLKTFYYKNPREYNSGTINRVKAHLKAPYRWLRSQFGENYTVQHNYDNLEDYFFGKVVPQLYPGFKIAPVEAAMHFSFEVKPEVLYERTHQLPMGCHAWWRYNLGFWKPHIQRFGYQL